MLLLRSCHSLTAVFAAVPWDVLVPGGHERERGSVSGPKPVVSGGRRGSHAAGGVAHWAVVKGKAAALARGAVVAP